MINYPLCIIRFTNENYLKINTAINTKINTFWSDFIMIHNTVGASNLSADRVRTVPFSARTV
jgi:hypothetical protein